MPLIGFLFIGAKYIENFLKFFQQLNDANSSPSDRPQKVGESDGEFTQASATAGSKKDHKPQGVKPVTKTEVNGQGEIKPVKKENEVVDTNDVLNETDKYLR